MSFLHYLRSKEQISERNLAQTCGLARETIRSCERQITNSKIEILEKIAASLDHDVQVNIIPRCEVISELSVVAISIAIMRDGFESWKIHVMNFVDYFRKTHDSRLIALPPIQSLDRQLQALLSAIVVSLCDEVELDYPSWSQREIFLERPWFVSGIEALKASSLVESPMPFRRNNIFVLENFLGRV